MATRLRSGSDAIAPSVISSPRRDGSSPWRASAWRTRHGKLPHGRGLGVAGSMYISGTNYPVYPNKMPQAGVMSTLGLVALAANVASALILIPHRRGDANVRAVWLFSRNDALGNIAVMVAARIRNGM